VYGRIITSVYTTITTVTVINDSSAIDSGLSLVAVGFLSYSPSSVPYALYAGGGTNSDITSLTALTSVPNGTVSNFPSVLGAFRNLVASSTGSSANVTVTADEIVLSNATNQYVTLRTVSLTIAGTTTGANALDTGTIAASTWYSVWAIWNGTTTAGLLSLSSTAPTLPSGYTHKARIGWVRTDGTGNKYPLAFKQYGRKVRYVVAGNVAALPQIAGASVGAPNTPTWVSQSTANFAPTTIANISLMAVCNGAGSKAICAPSNAYGSYSSTTNPPPMAAGASSAANVATTSNYDMILETANTLYWASDATAVLACTGWEDNL
jgi:hypothetical protein